ncbi:MAG: hypothetical protein H6658_08170 [Ardenticatenaceae bacterium]|nr:hypothetical protein [Ardenticatenaceae bacterium]
MNVVTQRVQGKLLMENGRSALLLLNLDPTDEQTADSLYLRFAFILQGVETPIFPAELLDDWGNPVKKWAMYEWVAEYGDEFPRAEIFGLDGSGRETQCFLRDLETAERVHCYAYPDKRTPIAEGVRVEAVLLPTAGVGERVKTKRPLEGKRPFINAKLIWWQVPPITTHFNLP